MATTSVTSGQIVSDISVTSGNTYNVAAGGIVNGASILQGGVISGDSAAIYSGTITDAGTISGGVLSGIGTTEVVSSGANIVGQVIGSGASATIMGSVNIASNVTLSGGTLTLLTGHLHTVNVAGSSGTLILGPGGGATTLASGNFFSSGNSAIVSSGGVLTSGYAVDGGSILLDGGSVEYTRVSSGGTLELSSGTTINTSILAGGHVIVDSGYYFDIRATSVKATSSGAFLEVKSGGTLGGATLLAGASAHVYEGGKLSGTTTVSSGGELYIQSINSGATVTLGSGATLSGLQTVVSAGRLNATSDYFYSGTVTNYGAIYGGILSGSAQLIASGSGANSLTSGVSIESGGRLYLGSGATGSANLVNGGTLEIASGAALSNNRFGSGTGGSIIIDSGVTWSNSNDATYGVTSGNTLVIQSGGTVSGTVIAAGGTTVISSGGILAGTQTVSSGGTLVLNGTAGTGAVLLSGDGANLVISGTTMPTNTISGWSPKDTIDLASIPAASVTSVTTTSTGITLYTSGGTYSLKVPGASSYGYTLSSDSNGGLIYTTCFAEGTALTTPDGESTVETLVPGTLVMTPKGAMPVKWLGHRSITVTDQRVPEENWLVRIREGALADGVPSRDLLVTQEHCMVFEGKLVPARMLVNGASILIDRTINSYTYYHVELDSHEAVWAENALTESYLDTGNRDQFDNHTVTAIFGGSKAGGSETLPLETSRAFVEPIHAAIAARAASAASAASAVTQPKLTTDPNLHLVTNFGQIIRPLRQANDRVMFMIPANVESVSLVSRASRPSDTIGPFVDDRRDLGVLVGDVSLFASRKTVSLTAHLSLSHLSGWHGLESSRYRWTDGNAVLSLREGSALGKNPSVLSVQIVSSGPYLMEAPAIQTELRQVG